ncbi:MAG TPA: H-NS family nucleoid-associated regulatory protein [Variovorax sp.]|jgi:DNA-binding protein H-NS
MAKTYKQIQKQIEQLQRQAESLRHDEIKGVVDRIKVAIAHYGLTAAHLGLELAKTPKTRATAVKSKSSSKASFGDGNGNVWSGRGPRPHWLRDALEAGRSIDEFRLGVSAGPAAAAAGAKRSKRAPSKLHYADDAGNAWGGRGPKPKWLKAALDSGKTLQDFLK